MEKWIDEGVLNKFWSLVESGPMLLRIMRFRSLGESGSMLLRIMKYRSLVDEWTDVVMDFRIPVTYGEKWADV